MYHPINKINCPPLNKLNDLARLTLEFCLTQTLALPEEEIRDSFVRHFTVNGFDKAGEWLWGKDVLVRKHVLPLVKTNIPEKREIFNAYVENQDIEARFTDGNFVYPTMPMRETAYLAYQSAMELSGNFYTILGEGVPGDKINETVQLNRQTVLRAYLEAQKINVCPGCDGAPPSIADEHIYEDLDHFFPKSKYPFLSVHQLNLTPFCKDCNQSFKRSKDAILDNDDIVKDVQTLNDIYHPYQRTAKSELTIRIELNSENFPTFKFICSSDSAPFPARLHSLQYILGIESRWTGDMRKERLEAPLEGFLLFGSQDDRMEPFTPDINWLRCQLVSAIKILRYQEGQFYNYIPASIYAEWIMSNPDALSRLLVRANKALVNLSVNYSQT